ncbi:unnamed protein product [Amoebophrya sp. A25]|nr:unnamed protein product [Amoebophrya sp. A25]|eukprot:GSA25T00025526001.1
MDNLGGGRHFGTRPAVGFSQHLEDTGANPRISGYLGSVESTTQSIDATGPGGMTMPMSMGGVRKPSAYNPGSKHGIGKKKQAPPPSALGHQPTFAVPSPDVVEDDLSRTREVDPSRVLGGADLDKTQQVPRSRLLGNNKKQGSVLKEKLNFAFPTDKAEMRSSAAARSTSSMQGGGVVRSKLRFASTVSMSSSDNAGGEQKVGEFEPPQRNNTKDSRLQRGQPQEREKYKTTDVRMSKSLGAGASAGCTRSGKSSKHHSQTGRETVDAGRGHREKKNNASKSSKSRSSKNKTTGPGGLEQLLFGARGYADAQHLSWTPGAIRDDDMESTQQTSRTVSQHAEDHSRSFNHGGNTTSFTREEDMLDALNLTRPTFGRHIELFPELPPRATSATPGGMNASSADDSCRDYQAYKSGTNSGNSRSKSAGGGGTIPFRAPDGSVGNRPMRCPGSVPFNDAIFSAGDDDQGAPVVNIPGHTVGTGAHKNNASNVEGNNVDNDVSFLNLGSKASTSVSADDNHNSVPPWAMPPRRPTVARRTSTSSSSSLYLEWLAPGTQDRRLERLVFHKHPLQENAPPAGFFGGGSKNSGDVPGGVPEQGDNLQVTDPSAAQRPHGDGSSTPHTVSNTERDQVYSEKLRSKTSSASGSHPRLPPSLPQSCVSDAPSSLVIPLDRSQGPGSTSTVAQMVGSLLHKGKKTASSWINGITGRAPPPPPDVAFGNVFVVPEEKKNEGEQEEDEEGKDRAQEQPRPEHKACPTTTDRDDLLLETIPLHSDIDSAEADRLKAHTVNAESATTPVESPLPSPMELRPISWMPLDLAQLSARLAKNKHGCVYPLFIGGVGCDHVLRKLGVTEADLLNHGRSSAYVHEDGVHILLTAHPELASRTLYCDGLAGTLTQERVQMAESYYPYLDADRFDFIALRDCPKLVDVESARKLARQHLILLSRTASADSQVVKYEDLDEDDRKDQENILLHEMLAAARQHSGTSDQSPVPELDITEYAIHRCFEASTGRAFRLEDVTDLKRMLFTLPAYVRDGTIVTPPDFARQLPTRRGAVKNKTTGVNDQGEEAEEENMRDCKIGAASQLQDATSPVDEVDLLADELNLPRPRKEKKDRTSSRKSSKDTSSRSRSSSKEARRLARATKRGGNSVVFVRDKVMNLMNAAGGVPGWEEQLGERETQLLDDGQAEDEVFPEQSESNAPLELAEDKSLSPSSKKLKEKKSKRKKSKDRQSSKASKKKKDKNNYEDQDVEDESNDRSCAISPGEQNPPVFLSQSGSSPSDRQRVSDGGSSSNKLEDILQARRSGGRSSSYLARLSQDLNFLDEENSKSKEQGGDEDKEASISKSNLQQASNEEVLREQDDDATEQEGRARSCSGGDPTDSVLGVGDLQSFSVYLLDSQPSVAGGHRKSGDSLSSAGDAGGGASKINKTDIKQQLRPGEDRPIPLEEVENTQNNQLRSYSQADAAKRRSLASPDMLSKNSSFSSSLMPPGRNKSDPKYKKLMISKNNKLLMVASNSDLIFPPNHDALAGTHPDPSRNPLAKPPGTRRISTGKKIVVTDGRDQNPRGRGTIIMDHQGQEGSRADSSAGCGSSSSSSASGSNNNSSSSSSTSNDPELFQTGNSKFVDNTNNGSFSSSSSSSSSSSGSSSSSSSSSAHRSCTASDGTSGFGPGAAAEMRALTQDDEAAPLEKDDRSMKQKKERKSKSRRRSSSAAVHGDLALSKKSFAEDRVALADSAYSFGGPSNAMKDSLDTPVPLYSLIQAPAASPPSPPAADVEDTSKNNKKTRNTSSKLRRQKGIDPDNLYHEPRVATGAKKSSSKLKKSSKNDALAGTPTSCSTAMATALERAISPSPAKEKKASRIRKLLSSISPKKVLTSSIRKSASAKRKNQDVLDHEGQRLVEAEAEPEAKSKKKKKSKHKMKDDGEVLSSRAPSPSSPIDGADGDDPTTSGAAAPAHDSSSPDVDAAATSSIKRGQSSTWWDENVRRASLTEDNKKEESANNQNNQRHSDTSPSENKVQVLVDASKSKDFKNGTKAPPAAATTEQENKQAAGCMQM